jgi:hypothetical protein
LLNLALCHEHIGRTATAFREYQSALRFAQRDARADRGAFAEQHLRALEPKLSRLRVDVTPLAEAALRVELDGEELEPARWGRAFEIDPGEHLLRARASGHVPYERRLSVGAEADFVSVRVPALASLREPRAAPPDRTLQRVAAAGVASVGVAALVAGVYFGAQASDEGSASDAQCAAPPTRCTAAGIRLGDAAQLHADRATLLLTASVLSFALGSWLWFREPAAPSGANAQRGSLP